MTAHASVDHEVLVFHLLDWLDARDRIYEEVVGTWQKSGQHLPAWEEANRRGFVGRAIVGGRGVVHLTPAGAAELRKHRFVEIMRNYLKVLC